MTAVAHAAPLVAGRDLLHAAPRLPPRASRRAPPPRGLDAKSRAWWLRLHGAEAVRDCAIAELHGLLRREARFHLGRRTRGLWEFPSSDLEDLAMQAADDALLAVLRKLDDFRGESQFWTWAKRFAELEAAVSIRRRLGRDRLADDPEAAFAVADPGCSLQERVEARERLGEVSGLIIGQLTQRQRAVLIAIAIDGVSPAMLAVELDTTVGAIYKTLHVARRRLTTQPARR